MEPNYSKIFNEKMMQTVSAFCSENEIKDIDGFILKCFKQGFDIKKYGFLEKTLNEDEKDLKKDVIEEKQLIKEVIVEKRVEVPVEIIKEVEVINEVIVEKEVIKEVEKIVTITNNEELEEKIFQLNSDLESERKIFSTKTEEMENSFQKEMSKKDEELDELRRNLDEKLDDTNQKMLQETLQKLRKELTEKNEKIKELIKINQDLQNTRQNKLNAVFLRGSNINDTI
jgi:hypothetical protein